MASTGDRRLDILNTIKLRLMWKPEISLKKKVKLVKMSLFHECCKYVIKHL